MKSITNKIIKQVQYQGSDQIHSRTNTSVRLFVWEYGEDPIIDQIESQISYLIEEQTWNQLEN